MKTYKFRDNKKYLVDLVERLMRCGQRIYGSKEWTASFFREVLGLWEGRLVELERRVLRLEQQIIRNHE